MTQDFMLANARLVLDDAVITGRVAVTDGLIARIEEGAGVPPGAIDCGGAYVAPGLIELHTDNLERHIKPRPNVDWPHKAAILAHDGELASVGITTVFDALRVGSVPKKEKTMFVRYARELASEILELRAAGVLKISHMLHLRAEICSRTLLEELAEFGPGDRVGILSLMDHVPGQRQYADESKWYAYMAGKHGMDRATLDIYKAEMKDLHAANAGAHEAAAVAAAARFGAVLASHDDMTLDQVAASAAHGVRIAEFPTSVVAARACHARGIAVIMGAPNVVRGGSHSGNVAAHELARDGVLDILSSDYVPAALLMGACRLAAQWRDLPRGMATVTRAPAEAVGLGDRGRLAAGLRADLVRFVWAPGDDPAVSAVWSAGRQVA